MKSYAFATIQELHDALKNKEITVDELRRYYIERFKKHDKQLNSAIEVFDQTEWALTGSKNNILYGIPGLVKDNICQKDQITSCASKILENFRSTYDATAVERLKSLGAYSLGRANCDEFAMGSSTETSYYGKTYNPWDLTRVPGGSSGGSIAAVAAGLVPWALGSETGGSVRQPAALCGIVGMKPTYGLVSRSGLVAYASSLDQIGVATRTVKDNALVLEAIAGQDAKDSTTLDVHNPRYAEQCTGALKPGLTIGVLENALNAEGVDFEVKRSIEEALKVLEQSGARIKRVSLPAMDYSAAIYFIISRAEAASNLARFDGVRYGYRDKSADTLQEMYEDTRQKGFGKEVKARIMIGNYVLSAGHAAEYYANARRAQRWLSAEYKRIFKEVDLLVLPTSPTAAFKIGAFDNNKLQMDLQDYFTCSANIAGIPAISIPCGFSKDGMPLGMQLAGPHLSEGLIYQTAYAYEQQTPWHTMHPKGFE